MSPVKSAYSKGIFKTKISYEWKKCM
jgi:hypothetical protein